MSSVRSRKSKASVTGSRNQIVSIKQEVAAVAGGVDTNKDSLAYLIEDRVDMVKQIFAVLDAKTIKSMAPDHLSGHTAESLQEYCLDELLGISNKRLLSIIDETKCPTDTDDSDSDVEKIEEHISLEEISSDSPDEASRIRTVRRSKHTKDGRIVGDTIRKRSSDGVSKKPMTMLELLELQYRAAAIRSQLAQEPVTKIELDSEAEDKAQSPALSAEMRQSATAHTASENPTVAVTNGRSAVVTLEPTAPAALPKLASPLKPRPVRLKRNFRQRQDENYDPSGDETAVVPEIVKSNLEIQDEGASANAAPNSDPSTNINPSTVAEQSKVVSTNTFDKTATLTAAESHSDPSNANDVESLEQQPAARSPTPDVIPIVASPPTFCISSESEGEMETRKQRTGNYINMPITVSINRSETEDEKFLRHVKESVSTTVTKTTNLTLLPSQKIGAAVSVFTKSKDIFVTTPAVSRVESAPVVLSPSQTVAPVVLSDPEEGELSDDDGHIIDESTSNSVVQPATASSADLSFCISDGGRDELENTVLSEQQGTTEPAVQVNASTASETSSDSSSRSSDEENDISCNHMVKQEPLALTYTTPDVIALDDDDEDIIDLGKENLDDFDVDAPLISNTSAASSAVDEGDSTGKDDEQMKDAIDCWDNRWARSKKVSKVIATARLGSKLRTRIKQNREREANEAMAAKAAADARADEEAAKRAAEAVEAANASATLEEGSVEQYATIGTAQAKESIIK